jgi:hypothetical protein
VTRRRRPRARRLTTFAWLLAVAGASHLAPPTLAAQQVLTARGWQEATTGSELETYLRILQLAGESPLYPWSVRGFSPQEVEHLVPRDTLHPWADRLPSPASEEPRGLELSVLRPAVGLTYNSTFPWAHGDGVAWMGRGLTVSVQAGLQARFGPVSLTLDPTVFWAQNAAFPLQPTGYAGPLRFANGLAPTTIDFPQRFGATPYSRLDPGESTLRLDLLGVTLGASTARQVWGPGIGQALVLNDAGPGFLHLFAGTARPVNLWIGHLHGRVELGRLEQSAYSPMPADSGRRLMAGFVATFVPRGAPGLEIGLTRWYLRLWPASGFTFSELKIPFQGIFYTDINLGVKYDPSNPNFTPEHQAASVFARWAFPAAGLEVFGEFSRNDRSYDLTDFLGEPDHNSAWMLGFMTLLHRTARHYTVLRAELASSRITDLAQLRPQALLYVHTQLLQGNTNRGVILGSPLAALGGAGSTLGLDFYRPDGRWTFEFTRDARQQPVGGGGVEGGTFDVPNALRVERLLFRHGWDLTAAATAVYELNRNFNRDAFDLRLDLGARVGLGRSAVAR